ncbi:MAG: alpha-amylase [Actinomyces sp.]|nr:MAG: alpha-amylase [Actinomyces sp.]
MSDDRVDGSAPASVTGWWTGRVGYEIYIRSFADSDGDGVGDLRGILGHLDHLVDLGVDVVWITPFYPSPMADFGYDVADYRDIDPLFGTLADFDALVAALHDAGLRLLVDLVPNHTSDQHPWFRASRSGRDDPHRDWYIWRDPAPDGGPPNNWVSHFGGPAWTFDEATGQYYLHLFLPEQPDLNWRNPAVVEAFDDILTFWLDRGVDGFRIDVAHALVKDAELRDNPQVRPVTPDMHPREVFWSFDHVHDLTQPESLEIFRRWRTLCDARDAVLLGETYVREPERLAPYLAGDGLHLGFWFGTMTMRWSAPELRRVVDDALAVAPNGVAWVLSSHDDLRAPTRFGGGREGRERALALMTLLTSLPGFPVIFQGDELALEDARIPPDRLADPVAVRNGGVLGRDGCRSPLPWGSGVSYGFSTNPDPWLPLGERREDETVAGQRGRPDSPLATTRRLLAVRRQLPALVDASMTWVDLVARPTPPPDRAPVAFTRGDVLVVVNPADESVAVDLDRPRRPVFSTRHPDVDDAIVTAHTLGPREALIAVAAP